MIRRLLVEDADGDIYGLRLNPDDEVKEQTVPDEDKKQSASDEDEKEDDIRLLIIKGELGRIVFPLNLDDKWEIIESDSDEDEDDVEDADETEGAEATVA